MTRDVVEMSGGVNSSKAPLFQYSRRETMRNSKRRPDWFPCRLCGSSDVFYIFPSKYEGTGAFPRVEDEAVGVQCNACGNRNLRRAIHPLEQAEV